MNTAKSTNSIFKRIISTKISISIGNTLIIASVIFIFFYFKSLLLHNGNTITGKNDDTGFGIDSLVRKVKLELVNADKIRIKNKEEALFQLKDFELEISFVVQQRITEKGELKYELIALEGSSEASTERAQKLKIHWDAIPPDTIKLKSEMDSSLEKEIENMNPQKNIQHEK